ncbi:hypothetical protein IDJ77_22875 [Mucilaginibacter sp. ZT4R22]|uniref:Surface antigen-like protein n=1 Tax=Mucilaginibacter pankratovii TaxID=2772110 RepID=A0ABR7WWL7_9SPHI|nr:hypothetical protein [Mucilaginibacter pankratovii]MBD1366674.1 hypothetical protein [Mucilaginibacter pankratovii]
MINRFCQTLFLLLFTTAVANAQQFGGNPPSIKWKQVNTPATKVIFPEGMDSAAMRVANIIQYINPQIKRSIGFKQKQVSIVLQNQTTISNAYVGLAPFRSEFYLTPSQNSFEIGSLYWPGQLAIHEFRHVQQYNNFNVGLSHALRVVFGEGGQALGNDLSIPNWFFEGDAVYNETLVSQQGRGRLPYFYNGFRALWAAGKDYSWMKLRNGSYVDYIPDHYPLGYMMVAYGREKFGNDFWGKVTHDAAAYNTGVYPFQNAIKKHSGQKYKAFRGAAFKYFKKQFGNDQIIDDNPRRHFVAHEEYPNYINDSTLIYLRTTYNHIPEFVLRSKGKERAIAVQDINTDNYFTYHDGKVVYAAYRPDLRWGYRNYNELVVLDINTGKERRITRKTKYFSPAFSHNGKTIVAVDVEASGKSALHLIDALNGKSLTTVPNPDNLFYTYPKFFEDDKIVSAVRNGKGQMALASIDIKTGTVKYFTPFSFEPIGFIAVGKGRIMFSKTTGAYDKLFVLSLKTGKVFLKDTSEENMSAVIGSYQPAVTDSKVAWVGLTPYGYNILEGTWSENDLNETPLREAEPLSDLGISKLEQDTAANLLSSIPNTPLPITKYSKAHGLFNFHSIFPNLNDPNYSLELAGENVLNTFQSRLSFNYNRDEGYKRIGYTAIYGALFPYISAGANYTFDRKGFSKGNSVYFNETDLHAGLEVPLNFTGGKTSTFLSAGSDVYYSQRRFQEAFRSQFADGHYTYLNNYISFSNEIQQAKQQINPRLAQSISLNYKTAIAGLSATQFLGTGSFYFPGLGVTHSLVISGAYQQKGANNSIGFSNDFPFSKGYTAESLDKMQKFGASYHFPIAYPDAGFANLAYLLRVRGYLFYDHTHATDSSFLLNGKPFKADFRSAGAALFFDGKLFNQGSVSFGIRYSYLLDDDLFGGNGKNRIELVLPVSIF